MTADSDIAVEVLGERHRQDEKWGEQNHPDGTGPGAPVLFGTWLMLAPPDALHEARAQRLAAAATESTDAAAANGAVTWTDILLEEVLEALAEDDPVKLRVELIQVAAVAQQWVSAIDRRAA
jgi:hypothetical protein